MNTSEKSASPRVIVEPITFLKLTVKIGNDERTLFSVPGTTEECDKLATTFAGTNVIATVAHAWRFRVLAANGQFVASSTHFVGKGVASSWARFIANGIGVQAEIPD